MQPLAAILETLERLAPLNLAADWDNVGLLLGDRRMEVGRVMTCLTVTPETVAEAVAGEAQLIVTHHPILFRAVKRLTADNTEGRMLLSLARAGIAVYSAHTAYDDAPDGINEQLARGLGLATVEPLRKRESRSYKIVVFVPDTDLGRVSDALFDAGAGIIGQYSQCSFRLSGTGTFFGSDASNPTVGQKGRREEVAEWRLEVVCPEGSLDRALRAMRKAHSYEEPAFDVYPLRPTAGSVGTGRVGNLAEPLSLSAFSLRVRELLRVPSLQIVGNDQRTTKRVAIVCGAGGELLSDAVRARADVFVTGEMRFHDCLAAQAQDLGVCLPGHHATERFAMECLANRLREGWPELQIWPARQESDPLRWYS